MGLEVMLNTLVIVESPAKAKKIEAYLGAGYKVRASLGHIRDLPACKEDIPAALVGEAWARLGIDVSSGFKPLYVVPASKVDLVHTLRELARQADVVLLATDPDREGEAIAWHLAELLNLGSAARRMTFHEITKEAILYAAQHTRPLDNALVNAQESRRLIDRLCGYGVSPVLWDAIGPGLSAGRVQSAALAALARREQGRMDHVSAAYTRVTTELATAEGTTFTAAVTGVQGVPLATQKDFGPDGQLKHPALLPSPEELGHLVEHLKSRPVTVGAVERSPYSTKPPAPFTTSTLQQEASKQLKMRPKDAMVNAQRLYESGKITYMRTDSPSLSQEATQAARNAALGVFGPASVPAQARAYSTKAHTAQEAHEAIRPAGHDFLAPDQTGLDGDELALYDLIFRRTVASQMLDLQGLKTSVQLSSGQVSLAAAGRVVFEPGFTRIYQDAAEGEGPEESQLPGLQDGQTLAVQGVKAEQKRTPAPRRFSEASLVRALEQVGIGRPSTYASILSTLDARGYTRVLGGHLSVTWLGLLVASYLQTHFPRLVDTAFTASMEGDLDRVASGELEKEAYLKHFWTEGLSPVILAASKAAPVVAVARAPGHLVTALGGVVVLQSSGKSVPLPSEILPEDLTPALAARVMAGTVIQKSVVLSGKRSASPKKQPAAKKPKKPAASV
jgi:DNA topoisomerase I